MNEPWVILTRRYGDEVPSPTAAQLIEAIAELYHETHPDINEDDCEEHGAASLRCGYDDGPMYVVEVSRVGGVVFEEWADQDYEEELAPPRELHDVSESEAIRLWNLLATGQLEQLRSQDWQ